MALMLSYNLGSRSEVHLLSTTSGRTPQAKPKQVTNKSVVFNRIFDETRFLYIEAKHELTHIFNQ